VGEIKKLIAESSQEFSPVLGAGVESNNKKNNEKSYKDAEKAAKDFDGGLKDPKKVANLYPKTDANRTTLDYNPRTEPDKEFKDKVEAQLQGYTSKLEKENKIEKAGAEFDNDGKIAKQLEDNSKELNKQKEDLAHSGLQSHNLEKEKKNTMYESNTPKRLIFKHTRFINESQMLARIPEEYKKDGQKIFMKDMAGNEYIVECEKSSTGVIETNVTGFNNKEIMNEQVSRIQQLMEYTPGKSLYTDTREVRINENQNFSDMMNLTRGLMKD
jgi:hypothetical protein